MTRVRRRFETSRYDGRGIDGLHGLKDQQRVSHAVDSNYWFTVKRTLEGSVGTPAATADRPVEIADVGDQTNADAVAGEPDGQTKADESESQNESNTQLPTELPATEPPKESSAPAPWPSAVPSMAPTVAQTAAPSLGKGTESPTTTPTVSKANIKGTEAPSVASTTSPTGAPSEPPIDRPPIPEPESGAGAGSTTGTSSSDWNTATDVGVNCQTAGNFFQRNSCKVAVSIQNHQVFYGTVFAVFFLYCFRRCLCACWFRKYDERGEYRAVAEHFGGFNDTAFDDEYSFNEEEYDDDDVEDDWSSGPKRAIEMVEKERNGGLTLEEMNG
jgi:hypothetical protein